MAGVFAPSKKHRIARRGGKGDGGISDGTMIALAAALMFPIVNTTPPFYRPNSQAKRAFGGSSQTAVSSRAVAMMERTARRVPEVMVRITGRQHGGGHVLANFSYISRLGHGSDKELGLQTSEDGIIHDASEMQKLAQEWQEGRNGRRATTPGGMAQSRFQ